MVNMPIFVFRPFEKYVDKNKTLVTLIK